jgi:Winged helix DNA-binding domain
VHPSEHVLKEKADRESARELAQAIAREGELLRIGPDSLRSNSLRYASTSAWGADLLDQQDRDEALHVLAGRYLSAFGPARVEDFQWWAGISRAQVVAALATITTVTIADGCCCPQLTWQRLSG